MPFLIVLIVTTCSIAGTAAFFSVYGLASTFSGTFWAVVFMGSSLEAGKLTAASFLYRYWSKVGWAIKMYLMGAVLALMVITSMGIFGFLSAAYQQDSVPLKEMEVQVKMLSEEEHSLITRKQAMDTQIAQLPVSDVKGRQKLSKTFDKELSSINARLPAITTEKRALNQKLVQVQAHTGPVTYIAKAMGLEVDDATKWMIFLIIVVFDPLAIVLTVCVNLVLKDYSEQKVTEVIVPPVAAPPIVPDVSSDLVIDEEKTEEQSDALPSLDEIHELLQEDQHVDPIIEDELCSPVDDGTANELMEYRDELLQQNELTSEDKQQLEDIERLLKRKQLVAEVRSSTDV